MLDLSGHDGMVHAFRLERLDELSELAERQPMNRFRVLFDFRKRLFFDRGHDHIDTLASRRLEHQKRKFPVSRNEAVST